MNLARWRSTGPPSAEREEMIPLRERAAILEVLRASFAALVVVFCGAVPTLAEAHRWLILAVSISYPILAWIPQVLRRPERRRILGLLQASLLLDGIYVAWVMLMTGGTESPFRFFIYAHIVAVTLVASYRTGLKIALWHTLLYLLLFQAATGGFLPATHSPFVDGTSASTVAGLVIFFRVCGFWMVAFAAAAFSALNERELRAQKIDLQQLTDWVAEADPLTSTADIATTLLHRLQTTFGFERGVVIASPKDDLRLIGSLGVTNQDPVEPGLDGVMDRAWANRMMVPVSRLDPVTDPRLTALLPDAKNVLVVPLFAERGYRLGVIALEHPRGDHIKRWILDVIGQFSTHAAMVLHGAWLNETIRGQLLEIEELKDQVIEQNLSLEARVAEQTEELRGMVTELRKADAHRRDLMAHIVTAQEEERERIAGDVHDDPVQRIVALNMRLQLHRRTLKEAEQIDTVDLLLGSVQSCIHSLRHLLFALRPPILDERGLGSAIREYLQEKEPDFEYQIEDLVGSRLAGEPLIVAYRIAQEALANAYKHAHATNVSVRIAEEDGGLLVQIQDDGVGFPGEIPRISERGHMGVSSMRERAELQGGWCEISSLPQGGASVRFWIPASAAKPLPKASSA